MPLPEEAEFDELELLLHSPSETWFVLAHATPESLFGPIQKVDALEPRTLRPD
jgi:hypothetical protein